MADRIHIHRQGRRLRLYDRNTLTMNDAVALMTGAVEHAEVRGVAQAERSW